MAVHVHAGVLHRLEPVSGPAGSVLHAGRTVLEFFKALGDVPDELLRMALQYEATRPELAARLRKASRRGWGW